MATTARILTDNPPCPHDARIVGGGASSNRRDVTRTFHLDLR
jgi:hypothetical protein